MAEKYQYELELRSLATGDGILRTERDLKRLGDTQKRVQDLQRPEKIGVTEAGYVNLDEAIKKTTRSIEEEAKALLENDAQRALANKTIAQLKQEVQQTPPVMDAAAKRTRNLGGATLEAARAFEDAQYGIRGVLNNIPGLISMLGGGPGLAGVISILAVATTILAEKFNKVGEEAKEAEERAEGLREKLQGVMEQAGRDEISEFVAGLEHASRIQQILNTAAADAIDLSLQEQEARTKVAAAWRQASLAVIEYRAATDTSFDAAEARRILEAKSAEEARALEEARIATKEKRARNNLEQAAAARRELEAQQAELQARLDELQAEQARRGQRINILQGAGVTPEDSGALGRELAALQAEQAYTEASIAETVSAMRDFEGSLRNVVEQQTAAAQALDRALAETAIEMGRIAEEAAAAETREKIEEATRATQQLISGLEAAADNVAAATPAQQEAIDVLRAAAADGKLTADEMVKTAGALQQLLGTLNTSQMQSSNQLQSLIRLVEQQQLREMRNEQRIRELERRQGALLPMR